MQTAPLIFILVAVGLALAMYLVSWFIRKAANRQMPGSRERGTHWLGRAGRNDDDDVDGDGL